MADPAFVYERGCSIRPIVKTCCRLLAVAARRVADGHHAVRRRRHRSMCKFSLRVSSVQRMGHRRLIFSE
eukprot:4239115-Pleurochrysis_carterae.AAC.3